MALPLLYSEEPKYRECLEIREREELNSGHTGGILEECVKAIESGDKKFEQVSMMNMVRILFLTSFIQLTPTSPPSQTDSVSPPK